MAIISDSFPNLINGVSQQAPALRLSSQVELLENANASVVRGLSKRQPFQHVAKLTSSDYSNAFIYPINRDTTERYIVAITDGAIKVFNLAGAEMTVTSPDGVGYLDVTGTANTSFKAVTIADTTFILNMEVTADLTTAAAHEALIWVKQGLIGHEYKVNINGSMVASFASLTSATLVQSTTVSYNLYTALVASLGGGGGTFNFALSENLIYLKRKDGADFTITVQDSYGNTAMSVIKETVQLFEDLPAKANPDMLIKVSGSNNSESAYWVKFVPNNAATIGLGQWAETRGPGIKYKLDAAKMPYTLVRTGPTAFTFRKTVWAERTAGDLTTAPPPSLVGQKINDIFVYRGRLGMLAGENVIMSRANDFTNYWPTTATTILDDDRIDYKLGGVAVAFLYHAVPFLDKLLLFSDQSQLTMTQGDTLTQKTVASTPSTFFDSQTNVKPINVGSSIYFTFQRGGFTGVREYFSEQQGQVNDAAEITAHCPNYIEGTALQLAASTTLDMATIVTSGDQLWVYQWLWNNNEKVQSAWHKWTFDAPPIASFFISDTLYALIQRSAGLYLEKAELSKTVDDGLTYIVHLDRRVTLARDSHSTAANTSTFTLPYYSADLQGVAAGNRLTIESNNDSTFVVVVTGDVATATFGIPYTFKAVLSKPFVKADTKTGGTVAVDGARFQVKRYDVRYNNTGYFTVVVEPDNYNTFTYPFSGRVVGAQENVLGEVALESGVLRVPICTRNEDVYVELNNDTFMPCSFLSVDWTGNFNPKAQRI